MRPTKVVRYEYSGDSQKTMPTKTSTRVLAWSSGFPVFQISPSSDVETDTDKEMVSTVTTCETETRCSFVTDRKGKKFGSDEIETTKLLATVTLAAPALLLVVDGKYTSTPKDKDTFSTRNTFADGKWTGESTTSSSTVTLDAGPDAGPDAAASKKTVAWVYTKNCVLDAKAVAVCKGEQTTNKVVSSAHGSREQKVVIMQGEVGVVESLELESTQTDYDDVDPKKVARKSVTNSAYDSSWRLTSRTETLNTEETTYDKEFKPVGKKPITRVTKSTYTYEGDSQRLASETRVEDGKQTKKIVYAY